MDLNAWLALTTVLGCVALLAGTRVAAEIILLGGVTLLLTVGVLTPAEALSGFANEGLITVALLYIVAAGIQETGGVNQIVTHVLGRPKNTLLAQARLMLPAAGMSAFLNNTPIVAAFIPAVLTWARRIQVAPSRLLIPLSYATILGGACTLIGTSTNLVVNGLLIERTGQGLGMFEIAWVGVPVALAGIAYILIFGRRLLPERKDAIASFENPKEYTVEMIVEPGGPIDGKTVGEAGLRHLHGLYLIEAEREHRIIPSVGTRERLYGNDRLVFAGTTESVADLRTLKGLIPLDEHTYTISDEIPERRMVEVAIAPGSDLVGKTIVEARFRLTYGASVVAIARNGERLNQRLGDIRLEPTDTLLLETRRIFLQQHRHSKDFLLVSEVENYLPIRHDKAWLAWSILGVLVVSVTLSLISMLNGALLAAGLMLATQCCSPAVARKSIDASVLLAIAASFGLGNALAVTGAAEALVAGAMELIGRNPYAMLAGIYLLTMTLTSTITNNAAAVLMFPVVVATAGSLGVDAMPFVITIMMAASASFATPISYQTNLMVYGPGGYHFNDFVRFGLPLNLITGAVTIALVPLIWPLGA